MFLLVYIPANTTIGWDYKCSGFAKFSTLNHFHMQYNTCDGIAPIVAMVYKNCKPLLVVSSLVANLFDPYMHHLSIPLLKF